MFKLYCLILCCLYFRFIYMNAFALESILMTLSRAKILLFFVKEIKNELFFTKVSQVNKYQLACL